MKEIFIDDDKEILLVGKPKFKYGVVHTEYNPFSGVKKIWIKKI